MFADRYSFMFGAGPFTSDGDQTHSIGKAEGTILVKSCEVFATGAVATHATAYITYKLLNLGTDASGTTVIATASTSQTGGTAIAAHVPWALTVTAANAQLTDGQVLGFVRDEATTDAAAPVINVVVRYTQLTAAD